MKNYLIFIKFGAQIQSWNLMSFDIHVTKYEFFKIQDGGRLPY